LKCLPENFLKIKDIRDSLEQYAYENYSKMIFMDFKGNVDIINEQSGIWKDGIWYSNGGIEDYIGYGFSGIYPYNPGEIRHKGGIMTNMMLANKDNWIQCDVCKGYHHISRIENNVCSGCSSYLKLLSHT